MASTSMAKRYQHVTDPIVLDVAKRVGGLIWTAPDVAPARTDPEDDGGSGWGYRQRPDQAE